MTDDQTYIRRAVLAATGAVLGLTGSAASDDGPENECYPNQINCDDDGYVKDGHGADDTQVRTRHCDDRQYERGPDDWSDSAITFQNCSSKTCSAYVEVTGVVDAKRKATVGHPEGSSLRVDLAAHGRQTLWFTGHITYLELDEHSVNVGISQRVDPCC